MVFTSCSGISLLHLKQHRHRSDHTGGCKLENKRHQALVQVLKSMEAITSTTDLSTDERKLGRKLERDWRENLAVKLWLRSPGSTARLSFFSLVLFLSAIQSAWRVESLTAVDS